MTFAVVGILGHNAKTVLLFFIPQIINFLYSLPQVRPCPAVGLAHTTDRLTVIIHLVHSPPQLFKLVPCPRHRMPGYVATSDCVCTSYAEFNMSELSTAGALVVKTCRALRLAHVPQVSTGAPAHLHPDATTTLAPHASLLTSPRFAPVRPRRSG